MSQAKYCQGPSCHQYKTKDRIRGHKGDKHYETRKRAHLPYNGNFCSLGCQDDWFRKFGNNAIDHYGRLHEPKRTDASGAWYKHRDWRQANAYYVINDLLGERRPISQAQYQDDNFTSPIS